MIIADCPDRQEQLSLLVPKHVAVSCASTQASRRLALDALPDVILFDVSGPAAAGGPLELARTLGSDAAILALVDAPEIGWVTEALSVGIKAMLSRDATREELALGIEAAGLGLVLLLPSSVNQMLTRFPVMEPDDLVEPLTSRELEVLAMMGDGISNKEIAARLRISEHTVKFHISSILGKLGAETRTEAVRMGIQHGWIAI
jgi:DNA-binding NarL/FixJ family response regulator